MEVVYEWKFFHVDSEWPSYNPSERIEVFLEWSIPVAFRWWWLKVQTITCCDQIFTCTGTKPVLNLNAVCQSMQELSLKKEHLLVKKQLLVSMLWRKLSGSLVCFTTNQKRYQLLKMCKKTVRSSHAPYKEQDRKGKVRRREKREETRQRKGISEMAQKERERDWQRRKNPLHEMSKT